MAHCQKMKKALFKAHNFSAEEGFFVLPFNLPAIFLTGRLANWRTG
jgi:hypothetical protein